MDMSSIITGLPLFQGLAPNQCAALAGIAQRRYYSRGQVFSQKGMMPTASMSFWREGENLQIIP